MIERTFSTRKLYAMLMKGRPDEPDSHQSIGVYDAKELQEYRARGWKPAREFMEMVDRARRKDV
ncbi:MAG: hypothetical protein HC794_01590 [Nitrospiraceae bacterium]|nr:hypothetical protein [Nitrospiraceae bacterium]